MKDQGKYWNTQKKTLNANKKKKNILEGDQAYDDIYLSNSCVIEKKKSKQVVFFFMQR